MVEISSKPYYFDNRLCLSFMFQNPYRFNILYFIFSPTRDMPYKTMQTIAIKSCDVGPYHTHMWCCSMLKPEDFNGSEAVSISHSHASFVCQNRAPLGTVEAI